jgi:hypothetical protein
LYRSRQKLRQAHVRARLGLPDEKGGIEMSTARVIALPAWPASETVLTSFVDRIGHLLAACGDPRPMSELMGVSGFAFRFKISNRTSYSDGLYIFDWRQTLRTFMDELGYEATMLCGQLPNSPVPLLAATERFPVVLPIEEAVLPFIRKHIDTGRPVLYFDTLAASPHVHEWALLYGYDDVKREVYVTDMMRPEGKTLSYADVADNPLRFLAAIERRMPAQEAASDAVERALRTLREAIRYARRGCTYVPRTDYLSYASGLAAYDRWTGYLQKPDVLPNRYGMGHLAAVYAESKRYAARYVKSAPLTGEPMRLALLAAEAYEQAADALGRVSEKVPFIRSSAMPTQDTLAACAAHLEKAKEFETAAIGYMENALTLWERGER